VVILPLAGAPALAHHSLPAEFDKSRQGELKGTIIGVWYKHPLARFRMEVTTDDGADQSGRVDFHNCSATADNLLILELDLIHVCDSEPPIHRGNSCSNTGFHFVDRSENGGESVVFYESKSCNAQDVI